MSQDHFQPNLPQPYCNPIGYALPISLPSPATSMSSLKASSIAAVRFYAKVGEDPEVKPVLV